MKSKNLHIWLWLSGKKSSKGKSSILLCNIVNISQIEGGRNGKNKIVRGTLERTNAAGLGYHHCVHNSLVSYRSVLRQTRTTLHQGLFHFRGGSAVVVTGNFTCCHHLRG